MTAPRASNCPRAKVLRFRSDRGIRILNAAAKPALESDAVKNAFGPDDNTLDCARMRFCVCAQCGASMPSHLASALRRKRHAACAAHDCGAFVARQPQSHLANAPYRRRRNCGGRIADPVDPMHCARHRHHKKIICIGVSDRLYFCLN
jgi:hypothetical protein